MMRAGAKRERLQKKVPLMPKREKKHPSIKHIKNNNFGGDKTQDFTLSRFRTVRMVSLELVKNVWVFFVSFWLHLSLRNVRETNPFLLSLELQQL